jgi:hypothetical protein
MNKQKTAIALCVHHKPWLLMSTLLSLALQDFTEYDVFVCFQEGDGSCPDKSSYDEYRQIAREHGINPQLSPHDLRVKSLLTGMGFANTHHLSFENDHALDSGAWYKFIKSGLWKEYDQVGFLQEGTILTTPTVLGTTLEFMRDREIDFVTAGHERRQLPKNFFLNYSTFGNKEKSIVNKYHDEKVRQVFTEFCRDHDFLSLFQDWSDTLPISTHNLIPLPFVNTRDKLYQAIRSVVKGHIFPGLFNQIIYNTYLADARYYASDTRIKKNGVVFYHDKNPYSFGCSCQHFVTNRFLNAFEQKLNTYNLYRTLDIPFCGTPYEVIWGMTPAWLKMEKWFFSGIHRVRKNLFTHQREDDPEHMSAYLNAYFKNLIEIRAESEFLKIVNHRTPSPLTISLNKQFYPT